MARSVRIDEAVILEWSGWIYARLARKEPLVRCETRLFEDIERALAPAKARPKRKPTAPERAQKYAPAFDKAIRQTAKEAKRERRAAIRKKVFARAAEGTSGTWARCEGPAESDPRNDGRCAQEATELLHVFGRGKGREPESERNCLAACGTCHRAETRNHPDGASWWMFFGNLFARWGFAHESQKASARAFLEATRSSLPAAPGVRR